MSKRLQEIADNSKSVVLLAYFSRYFLSPANFKQLGSPRMWRGGQALFRLTGLAWLASFAYLNLITVDAPIIATRYKDIRNNFYLPEGIAISCGKG